MTPNPLSLPENPAPSIAATAAANAMSFRRVSKIWAEDKDIAKVTAEALDLTASSAVIAMTTWKKITVPVAKLLPRDPAVGKTSIIMRLMYDKFGTTYQVHSRGKALVKDVNFDKVARRTPGFTRADLQNLMNEAAILAARRYLKEISKDEIAGPENKNVVVSEEKKKLVQQGWTCLCGCINA